MRIFIAGQKSFGAAVADMITAAGHTIAGVCCPLNVEPIDPLHRWAREADVDCVDPSIFNAYHIQTETDLIVCAHNHVYVTRELRDAARLGAISYHPSLLPRHRGRDAIEWTVRMHDGADTGPIAAQEWCWVEPGWAASDLWREKLFPLGVRLIGRVLHDIGNGHITRMPQNERVATFEPAITHARLAEQ